MGDDYRLLHAQVMVAALRGENSDSLLQRIDLAMAARPKDAVEELIADYELAQALALSGDPDAVVEFIAPRLSPPGIFTPPYLELDPAFDAVRDDLAFNSLLEQHR